MEIGWHLMKFGWKLKGNHNFQNRMKIVWTTLSWCYLIYYELPYVGASQECRIPESEQDCVALEQDTVIQLNWI